MTQNVSRAPRASISATSGPGPGRVTCTCRPEPTAASIVSSITRSEPYRSALGVRDQHRTGDFLLTSAPHAAYGATPDTVRLSNVAVTAPPVEEPDRYG